MLAHKARVGGYATQEYLRTAPYGSHPMRWNQVSFRYRKAALGDPVRIVANRRSPLPGTLPRHIAMEREFAKLDNLSAAKMRKYPLAERYNFVKNFGMVREWNKRNKTAPVSFQVPIGKNPGPKVPRKKPLITHNDYRVISRFDQRPNTAAEIATGLRKGTPKHSARALLMASDPTTQRARPRYTAAATAADRLVLARNLAIADRIPVTELDAYGDAITAAAGSYTGTPTRRQAYKK